VRAIGKIGAIEGGQGDRKVIKSTAIKAIKLNEID